MSNKFNFQKLKGI